jgi:hypothetical protein
VADVLALLANLLIDLAPWSVTEPDTKLEESERISTGHCGIAHASVAMRRKSNDCGTWWLAIASIPA